jgi:hypothetical protein
LAYKSAIMWLICLETRVSINDVILTFSLFSKGLYAMVDCCDIQKVEKCMGVATAALEFGITIAQIKKYARMASGEVAAELRHVAEVLKTADVCLSTEVTDRKRFREQLVDALGGSSYKLGDNLAKIFREHHLHTNEACIRFCRGILRLLEEFEEKKT